MATAITVRLTAHMWCADLLQQANRTLQHLELLTYALQQPICTENKRHGLPRGNPTHVSNIVLKLATSLASATRVELCDDALVFAIAARAAVMAIHDDLIRPQPSNHLDSHAPRWEASDCPASSLASTYEQRKKNKNV